MPQNFLIMRYPLLIIIALLLLTIAPPPSHAEVNSWDGLWFECEYSGRQAPPRDDCALLDDDGFFFETGKVTYMKVLDSDEEKACKKERKGQCFWADTPSITVSAGRKGNAEFTENSIGLRFMACTQIFHTSPIKNYIEARPDEDRCFWAGEKYFYLRKYNGIINIDE